MSVSAELPRTAAPPQAVLRPIDCDIHPTPSSRKAFHPYLSERWRRHLEEYGSFSYSFYAGRGAYPRFQRNAARLDSWPANGKPPGADLPFLREQHLDAYDIAFGILMPLIDANSSRNSELASATCAATNAWQIDEFVSQEARLRASIVVCPENVTAAVAEIERHAIDRRFVQVQLATRSVEPLGNRRYWPIFAAAEAAGLPVGFHVGGPAPYPPSSGGWPSFYIEYHQVVGHSAASLLMSMILEGVFDQFPKLRIVVVECGFAWVPSFTWRLDKHFERLRSEVPHLQRKPSDYMRDHVWFTTQPVEEPEDPADLRRLFDWIGFDRMMFATDYPHWDFDDPNRAIPMVMSGEERRMIFRDNARAFFGLPDA